MFSYLLICISAQTYTIYEYTKNQGVCLHSRHPRPCRGAWGRLPRGLGPPAEGPGAARRGAWGRPNREGHRRPPPPWGPGKWGRPNREGHRRRRRGARGGGRPQRVPDKLIKYSEKTDMRETTTNPVTGNLQSFARFRRKPKMIQRAAVNTTILVVAFRRKQY